MDYRLYWIWLSSRAGVGSRTAADLVNMFGNAVNVYKADIDDVIEFAPGMSANKLKKIKEILSDKSLDEAERILKEAEDKRQTVLVPTDTDFPKSLLGLQDAPMVLYVLGDTSVFNSGLCISVVGTRKMSPAGKRNGFSLGYSLASSGATVVSGMALGIDSMAHAGALCAGKKTIAVLGTGADVPYPSAHKKLYAEILKNGAVVSEYPPSTGVNPGNFPVRNRLISGLSQATVLVEAQLSSGSLITARHAVFQGRSLYAFPGEVGSDVSAGTNELLKNGARAATSASDVLGEFEFLFPRNVDMNRANELASLPSLPYDADEMGEKYGVSYKGKKEFYGSGINGGNDDEEEFIRDLFKKPKVRREDRKRSSSYVSIGDENSGIYPEEEAEARKKVPSPRENRIELDLLDETCIEVYNSMKPDVPMIPDDLVRGSLDVSDVLSALSMLELAGAVESGAGGYFLRRSAEDLKSETIEE